MHRSRGRGSNRKIPQEIKDQVLELYRQNYEGFGPTLAQEKLHEREGISISDETLRIWLLRAGLWKKRRKGRQHRQWRPRKDRNGEIIQVDGSHHDWFEGRGPACVFMGYSDDATGKVYGRFYEYEGDNSCHGQFQSVYQEKWNSGKPLHGQAQPSRQGGQRLLHPKIILGEVPIWRQKTKESRSVNTGHFYFGKNKTFLTLA